MHTAIQAVLFDLDGTLVDTAPDLAAAANALRIAHGYPALALNELRPFVSQGARGMLGRALNITPEHPDYSVYQQDFLARYANRICLASTYFVGIPELLDQLEQHGIAWGIVTNKHTRFTRPLAAALGIDRRTACIVSGDTTLHAKPHPAPLFHAAALLGVAAKNCVYVGDDERDIIAGKAAGMSTVAAAYGYCGGSDPQTWQADWLIQHPAELANLIFPTPASI